MGESFLCPVPPLPFPLENTLLLFVGFLEKEKWCSCLGLLCPVSHHPRGFPFRYLSWLIIYSAPVAIGRPSAEPSFIISLDGDIHEHTHSRLTNIEH